MPFYFRAFVLQSERTNLEIKRRQFGLKANYESALQHLQNGKYENVRYLEIDGVKGVEFTETMPEENDDSRRRQWIAFRNYL